MADEFQLGSGNWWDNSSSSSRAARFETTGSSSSAGSTAMNSGSSSVGISYGWPTEIVDTKAFRPSMDSMSVSAGSSSSNIFQDSHKLQPADSSSSTLLPDPNVQIMSLTLSSHGLDWSQALLRGEKGESNFRSMLQEDLSSNTNFQQQAAGGMGSTQEHWKQKMYSVSSDDPSVNVDQVFSLNQPQFSSQISSNDSTITSQGLAATNFQMDSTVYASPSAMFQGLMGSDNQSEQSSFETSDRLMNFHQYPSNYGINYPQFLRPLAPKQQPPQSQLRFPNNSPFWNASTASTGEVRPTFFQSLQPQFPLDDKPKNTLEVRDLSTMAKKSSNEPSNKRPRNESPSPLPAFKVRKEQMGDRITALQQLVSPFGKTDTASVLSEAIEYIKFLHGQLSFLRTPYMKSGASIQHQLGSDKSKDAEGPNQDLRSRGLCLFPISSTFPITHETTVDYCTPKFGGTYR